MAEWFGACESNDQWRVMYAETQQSGFLRPDASWRRTRRRLSVGVRLVEPILRKDKRPGYDCATVADEIRGVDE